MTRGCSVPFLGKGALSLLRLDRRYINARRSFISAHIADTLNRYVLVSTYTPRTCAASSERHV